MPGMGGSRRAHPEHHRQRRGCAPSCLTADDRRRTPTIYDHASHCKEDPSAPSRARHSNSNGRSSRSLRIGGNWSCRRCRVDCACPTRKGEIDDSRRHAARGHRLIRWPRGRWRRLRHRELVGFQGRFRSRISKAVKAEAVQTAREQRAGCDLNRMCHLFPSSPMRLPPRFTHRFRSGPAHSASSGQAIFALPGSVRSAFSVVQKGSLHTRPRMSHR